MVKPVRPSEDIPALEKRMADLERQVAEIEGGKKLQALEKMIVDLYETISQFQAVLECSPHPAPVFLHWKYDTELGCQRGKATYGRYSLEVINGSSAVGWYLYKGDKLLDAGGGYVHFDMGFDDAEAALRRQIQAETPKG